LVSSYFRSCSVPEGESTPGFGELKVVAHRGGGMLPWLSLTDPFYAVMAKKV
jgi:hypothetical protein